MKKPFEEAFLKAYEIEKNIKRVDIGKTKINVREFGVMNNDRTDNCDKINGLIRKHAKDGGAQLVFPEGIYFFDGPIVLESGIHIHLEKGAVLKFGSNPKKYLINRNRQDGCVKVNFEGTTVYNYAPCIYARNVENISITGKGSITQTEEIFKWRDLQKKDQLASRKMNNDDVPPEKRSFGLNHYLRFGVIGIYESKRILIEGVKIFDCSFWLVHFVLCEDIVCRNLEFSSFQLNSDGIDPESSKNILIEGCKFGNGDDNIAIKSFRDLEGIKRNIPTENVYVRKCSFHGVNAMSIGSEISGGARNIFVEDCTSHGPVERALHIKTNRDRGGITEHVYMRNMVFGKCKEGISIIMDYKGENTYNRIPTIRNIYIGNIVYKEVTDHLMIVKGLKESKVNNLNLVQIKSSNQKRIVEEAEIIEK